MNYNFRDASFADPQASQFQNTQEVLPDQDDDPLQSQFNQQASENADHHEETVTVPGDEFLPTHHAHDAPLVSR